MCCQLATHLENPSTLQTTNQLLDLVGFVLLLAALFHPSSVRNPKKRIPAPAARVPACRFAGRESPVSTFSISRFSLGNKTGKVGKETPKSWKKKKLDRRNNIWSKKPKNNQKNDKSPNFQRFFSNKNGAKFYSLRSWKSASSEKRTVEPLDPLDRSWPMCIQLLAIFSWKKTSNML